MIKRFLAFSMLFTLVFTIHLNAQSYQYITSIGQFDEATAFSISPEGFIYVADAYTNEIYKLDTLGTIITQNGGYGWEGKLLDSPVDVYASPLTIIVTDYNNHAVKHYDRMLNFINAKNGSEFSSQEKSFAYPLSCAISGMGDMYLLDSDDNTILVYDFHGNFIRSFGGFDYGNYSLENPLHLTVGKYNDVFVLDDYMVIKYDSFGIGLDKIILDEYYGNISYSEETLFLTNDNTVAYLNQPTQTFEKVAISFGNHYNGPPFVSTLLHQNKLYILTQETILVFAVKG